MPTGGSHRGAIGRSDNGLAPRPEPGETQTPTPAAPTPAAPTPAAPTPAAPTSAAPTPAALCSFALGPADITVILGDARQTLPQWQGQADAWYLDGFSPARNPELWSPELLAEVARHTRPHGSFATYTAAGHVRRALQAAGFQVERRPGYGQKRHMTRGSLGAP